MVSNLQSHPSPLTSHPLTLLPWGWNPLLIRQLADAGLPAHLLPTPTQMAEYRACASRQTAVRLLERLRTSWPDAFGEDGMLVGESTWCETEEQVAAAIASYDGKVMLKAPWSGSGRGVKKVFLDPRGTHPQLPWLRRTLQRQGGVEVEPLYNKVQDFAMEFWAEDGRISYDGLSVFSTTEGGVYAGNLVASEAEKERRLAQYVPTDLLHAVRCRLENLLSDGVMPTWYTGPLGVDLMVVGRAGNGQSFFLHPFIELNLRMTMGWVALQLNRKLAEGESATFHIDTSGGHYRAVFTKKEA